MKKGKYFIIGIGGAGCCILNILASEFDLENRGCIGLAIDEDEDSLKKVNVKNKFFLCRDDMLPRSLNSHMNCESGKGTVIAIFGAAGGYSCNVGPAILDVASALGCSTEANVIKPFAFEGAMKCEQAVKCIEELTVAKHPCYVADLNNDSGMFNTPFPVLSAKEGIRSVDLKIVHHVLDILNNEVARA